MDEPHSEKGDVVQHEYAHEKESDGFSITEEARGDNLPDNYFLSWQFIGTIAVSTRYILLLSEC